MALKPLCTCDPGSDKSPSCASLTADEKHDLITKARNVRVQIGNRKQKATLMAAMGDHAEFRGGNIQLPGIFFVAGHGICVDAYRLAMGWTARLWNAAKYNPIPHPHPNPPRLTLTLTLTLTLSLTSTPLSPHRAAVKSAYLANPDANTVVLDDEDGATSPSSHREAATRAIGWLQVRLDETAGGVNPAATGRASNERMMDRQDPSEWYLDYLLAMEDSGDSETVGPTYFGRLYTSERKALGIWDRKWLPFAQCGECSRLKTAISTATTKEERQKLRTERTEHLALTTKCRKAYYVNRELARQQPEEYLSTIADGMDQAKLRTPHFARENKAVTAQLDYTLQGVLFHGAMKRMECFLVPHTYKGGSNVTIHCLNESLKRMQAAYKKAGLKWPHTWFLQLDNTTKENKNQFVLAYLQSLVDTKVFKRIEVSFLPVGHTHEDIDQRFSVIARRLRLCNILSIQQMAEFLRAFFAPQVISTSKEEKHKGDSEAAHVEIVPWLYDFRGLITQRHNPNPNVNPHSMHNIPNLIPIKAGQSYAQIQGGFNGWRSTTTTVLSGVPQRRRAHKHRSQWRRALRRRALRMSMSLSANTKEGVT